MANIYSSSVDLANLNTIDNLQSSDSVVVLRGQQQYTVSANQLLSRMISSISYDSSTNMLTFTFADSHSENVDLSSS